MSAEETQQVVGDTLQARDFSDKISYAFQLATAQGPLCNEAVQGIAVFLEEVTIAPSMDDESTTGDKLGRLTGEVIKTVQQAIRQGFLDWSPRLLLAIYSCEIQASGKPASFLSRSVKKLLLSNIPRRGGPRSRLRCPQSPPRSRPLRHAERRHAILHHSLRAAGRGVLRLQRRDPQAHIGLRVAAARLPGLRDLGRGSVLGPVHGG